MQPKTLYRSGKLRAVSLPSSKHLTEIVYKIGDSIEHSIHEPNDSPMFDLRVKAHWEGFCVNRNINPYPNGEEKCLKENCLITNS